MPSEELLTKISRDMKTFPLSDEVLEGAFFVFAIKVCTEGSTGQRKLQAGRLYYLYDGFNITAEGIFVDEYRYKRPIYDYYLGLDDRSPHVSVSAIVGENGSGKSSLIEYELRLINNYSVALFGEFAKEKGYEHQHLHYVENMDGELFYLWKRTIYQLRVCGRSISLSIYGRTEIKDGRFLFILCNPPIDILAKDLEQEGTPIHGINCQERNFKRFQSVLPEFFYTIVLNQSVYAYNTSDFRWECNTEEYERIVRGGRKKDENGNEINYSAEDKCWLSGLFHKNDGYQIPLVLSPCRKCGNYDINTENKLAYERLVSQLVLESDEGRIINGHLKVNFFELSLKKRSYNLAELHDSIGYSQFTEADFSKMKKILLEHWGSLVSVDLEKVSHSRQHGALALNYLVYKTLKIAATYDEYSYFRNKFLKEKSSFDELDFSNLVDGTIANNSHVCRKLYRTIAYILWDIYDKHPGDVLRYSLDEIREKWKDVFINAKLNVSDKVYVELLLEAYIYPPFFDLSIGLWDMKSGKGDVRFEHLSSGEKQQAYTISSIVYHLKNLDSVKEDQSTKERVSYECVQIILEEVELYYHPELQRSFIRNILDQIKQSPLNNIKWIDIQIVTHSPFVLSDIPSFNVLALRNNEETVESIQSFGANIHDMLKLSFFLENGTTGAFSQWMVKRIARCLRVHRWVNGAEIAPAFIPSLREIPEEYDFLSQFRTIDKDAKLNTESFNIIYSPSILLSLINLIEEPVVRRVLLDDYRRTFPKNNDGYLDSMRALLQSQIDALDK